MLGEKNTTRIFTFESASVRTRKTSHDEAVVTNLYSKVLRQGHARKVMELVLKWADAENIKLTLIAMQYGRTDGLPNTELVAFYESLGFVRLEESSRPPVFMARSPQEIQGV